MSILIATDFGAGGAIALVLFAVWVAVIVLVVFGVFRGLDLLKSESPRTKKWGLAFVLCSGSLPFCCCLLPPHAIRLAYGNYPLGYDRRHEIQKGMTQDEVKAILGNPHGQYNHTGKDSWHYYIDSFGSDIIVVYFDDKGRVVRTARI